MEFPLIVYISIFYKPYNFEKYFESF